MSHTKGMIDHHKWFWKVVILKCEQWIQMMTEGQIIQVREFKYLRTITDKKERFDKEINNRRGKVRIMYNRLKKKHSLVKEK